MSKKRKKVVTIDVEMPLWGSDLLPEIFAFIAQCKVLHQIRTVCKVFDRLIRERVVVLDLFQYENDSFPSFRDFRFEKIDLSTEKQAQDFLANVKRLPGKLMYLCLKGLSEDTIVNVGNALKDQDVVSFMLDLSKCTTSKWISPFTASRKERELDEFGLISASQPETVSFDEKVSRELYEFMNKKCNVTSFHVLGFENFVRSDFSPLFFESRFECLSLGAVRNADYFKEVMSVIPRNNSLQALSILALLVNFSDIVGYLCDAITQSKSITVVNLNSVKVNYLDIEQLLRAIGKSQTIKHLHVHEIVINCNFILKILEFYFKYEIEIEGKRFECLKFEEVVVGEEPGTKERDFVFLMMVFFSMTRSGSTIKISFEQKEKDTKKREIFEVLGKHGILKEKNCDEEIFCFCGVDPEKLTEKMRELMKEIIDEESNE